MIKIVHIFDANKPELQEPILLNFDNISYMRQNYDFNCTNVYFVNGDSIIIKEQLDELI